MILSGPKACRGSTNDASIFARSVSRKIFGMARTHFSSFLAFITHSGGKRIVDSEGHAGGFITRDYSVCKRNWYSKDCCSTQTDLQRLEAD